MEIAQLILTFGIPLAEKIWQMSTKPTVTQTDWDQLKELAKTTAQDQMRRALDGAGIDINSEQGKALLALTR